MSGPDRPVRPTSRGPTSRGIILALAAVAVLLGGCGKKGAPGAPPGREAEFTYPHAYPAPATVVPPLPSSAAAGEEAADEEAASEEAVSEEAEPDLPVKMSTPYKRSKTRTYRSQ